MIPNLLVASLFAAFVATARAETRLVNQGRSGYTVRAVKERAPAVRDGQRETRVALVMEKPNQGQTMLRNFGRSGFRYRPTDSRAN